MDTSDEWITQRSGIKTRYWVTPGTNTSDLATESARATLASSGNARACQAIIAATLSPDFYFPGIGVLVQKKLGLPPIPAFDIRQQCSGFLYGLEMATALVDAGRYERILLIGAEVQSNSLDLSTRGRDVAVLFGDGAGSCIVERDTPAARSERQAHTEANSRLAFELLGTELHSDGEGAPELWCEAPGSSLPHRDVTPEVFAMGRTFPRMNGRRVFESAVRRMVEVSQSLLAQHGITGTAVRLFVPHQANSRINQMVAEQLGLKPDQVMSTIERYGNTTAATIPIGMTDAIDEGRIQPDDIVLQAAFGSGFTWGAAILRAC